MKFIVDAQLPKSLTELISDKGFDCIHTLDLPAKNQTKDSEISRIAGKQDRVVITKDTDFLQSHLIKSSPNKLILIKFGNVKNSQLLSTVKDYLEKVVELMNNSRLVEWTHDEIIVHN